MTDDAQTQEKFVVRKLRELGLELEALNEQQQWRQWLQVQATFPRYSMYNNLLILQQRPDATEVQSYPSWQRIGRQVERHEKSFRIMAPIIHRDRETGEEEVRGFKLVPVFDYAQTRPERRIEVFDRRTHKMRVVFEGEPYVQPVWPKVPESVAGELLTPMVGAAHEHGCEVAFVPKRGDGARGWCLPAKRSIFIVDELGPTEQLVVLCHELGHVFDPEVGTDTDRARRERVAESVAWLTATSLGVDMAEQTAFYLTSWRADAASLVAVGKRVVSSFRQVERITTLAHFAYHEETAVA